MNFFFLSFVIFSLLSTGPTASPELSETPKKQRILGGGHYGAETLDSLQISGLVKLNGTTVTESLQVTGSLISLYAHLNTIDVSGEANLTDTHIDNIANVIGSLQAVRSTFNQKVNLLAQKAVFTNCKLQSILIRQDGAFKGKQLVELKQGTIVNGSIVFEGGKGEILLYPGSRILGTVTGGKVIRK